MAVSIRRLTHLGFYLNGAAGSGKYDSLTIKRVKVAIDDGAIFQVLTEELGTDVDLSPFQPTDFAELLVEWQNYVNAVDERRKLAVERGGLVLLVAYILEGIQERTPR